MGQYNCARFDVRCRVVLDTEWCPDVKFGPPSTTKHRNIYTSCYFDFGTCVHHCGSSSDFLLSLSSSIRGGVHRTSSPLHYRHFFVVWRPFTIHEYCITLSACIRSAIVVWQCGLLCGVAIWLASHFSLSASAVYYWLCLLHYAICTISGAQFSLSAFWVAESASFCVSSLRSKFSLRRRW